MLVALFVRVMPSGTLTVSPQSVVYSATLRARCFGMLTVGIVELRAAGIIIVCCCIT